MKTVSRLFIALASVSVLSWPVVASAHDAPGKIAGQEAAGTVTGPPASVESEHLGHGPGEGIWP